MGLRKSFSRLTTSERNRYLEAVLTLKNTTDPLNAGYSIYDRFVAMHIAIGQIVPPGTTTPLAVGHGNAGFLPWHRKFILEYEHELQAVHPDVTLPYWDWIDHAGTQLILFQDEFMGPNGTGATSAAGGQVTSGYFAFNAPAALPPWWPAGLPGFRMHASLTSVSLGTTLRRGLGWHYGVQTEPFDALTLPSDITTLLAIAGYDSFRSTLETGTRLHGFVHNWTGGHLRNVSVSPNDPLFFMHHCNIDRLWAMWQVNEHMGATSYVGGSAATRTATTDLMWPWVGAAAYSAPIIEGIPYAMAVFPATTYGAVLDHRSLGYSYDTEVVIGVALDQSFSMTGTTPIAVVGSPNLTKWEAAVQAVANLLHDCDAALASATAYVTGGVQAFTTSGAANQFTPVFAPPTGIIKDTSPHSETQFNTNIGAIGPLGATPLAGALSSTEAAIVRAPFGNQPPNETRFMYFLTDGLETAPPLLSSLAFNQFPDTLIFAMGFGMGGGWNGIDYTTIHTIVDKGKTPPPAVPHHFMGDDLTSLDKFFTESLATALNFAVTIDPVYELFPGEFVDTDFTVTSADATFLIVCLGYDFKDENWQFELIAPDGKTYSTPSASPFQITFRRRNARATIFLRRNAAPEAQWLGTWTVRASYRVRTTRSALRVTEWMLLKPPSAPPVRGPVYGRTLQTPKERLVVRAIPAKVKSVDFNDQFGITTVAGEACAVSVNIYDQGLIRLNLAASKHQLFAGDDFDVILAIDDRTGGKLTNLRVASRLVAPAHNLGDAFADLKTIPVPRTKFIVTKKKTQRFDEVRFLAEYERLRPNAFAVRDEALAFRLAASGHWVTNVRENRVPGVYHISVLVEGTWYGPSGRPEPFTRLIARPVGIGLRIDPKASKAVATKTKNGIAINVTPRDALGNVAMPTRLGAPMVRLDGEMAEATHVNDYSGEHRFEVTIGKGKQPRSIEIEIGGVKIPARFG